MAQIMIVGSGKLAIDGEIVEVTSELPTEWDDCKKVSIQANGEIVSLVNTQEIKKNTSRKSGKRRTKKEWE